MLKREKKWAQCEFFDCDCKFLCEPTSQMKELNYAVFNIFYNFGPLIVLQFDTNI